jgi:hypothetical protein
VGYAGGSALPAIYPKMHLQPGASTQWLPDDTKTGGEDGPMEVPVLGGSLCSITQLGFLAQKRYTRRDHRINTKKRDIP